MSGKLTQVVLYQWLKREELPRPQRSWIPDPNLQDPCDGPDFAAANAGVEESLDKHSASPPKKKQRGVYHVYDAKTRATIAKTAEACGLISRSQYLQVHNSINKKAYRKHLVEIPQGWPEKIQELPTKQRGRPLILGPTLDKKVLMYIHAILVSGCAVNRRIVLGCALGIVREYPVDVAGSRTVSLASTGHEKLNVTVAFAAAASGDKKCPFIISKGKGKTAEDRELKARRDIHVVFSDNGWFNDSLTIEWLQRVLGSLAFRQRLLIWDSYRCHLSEAVRDSRRRKKVDTAVIPGGCTGLIQAPDVSWNRPFKSHLRNQYDEWLLSGEKTYTAAGNLRAVSKTTLCDMVVKAWESISSTLIVKSFQCCGLLPNPSIGDITCFKDGRPAAAGRDQLREAMEAPLSGNTVPPAATCESDDLDHGAVFLEEAEPVDQDGGGSSTIDCSDEAEGE